MTGKTTNYPSTRPIDRLIPQSGLKTCVRWRVTFSKWGDWFGSTSRLFQRTETQLVKSCGRPTNPEIQLADNTSRVSPFALRYINTRTPRRHVIKETVILAAGSSDATYLKVSLFNFDLSLTLLIFFLTVRGLIQTPACQRYSWQKRFPSFFPERPEGPKRLPWIFKA